jgi:hypothetical protein
VITEPFIQHGDAYCIPSLAVAHAFRCCPRPRPALQTMMLGQEPRQTTSNLGALNKPSIQALIHGLNRHYYSIGINYRCAPRGFRAAGQRNLIYVQAGSQELEACASAMVPHCSWPSARGQLCRLV